MLTTCPECHTTFRISQAQLDRRRGLVRCGRCSAVFNAYDTLLPELQTPAQADAAAVPPTEAGSGPGASPPVGNTDTAAPASPAPPDAPSSERTEDRTQGQPTNPQAGESARPQPKAGKAAAAPAEAKETPESILLAELPVPSRTGRMSTVLWGLAGTVLAFAFGLQLVFFLRTEIVSVWPQSRALLMQACARLGCDLPLPQDVNAVRIDASSLETDPEDKAHAVLDLTLSNRSAQTVAWPHLLLTLTDTRNTPIAQRPFTPTEYLGGEADVASGMPPGHEREIRLQLEIDGLPAYGYQLDKRYP